MPSENRQLAKGWQIVDDQGVAKLTREYKFADFATALQFVNRVGELAEKYRHHPYLELEWGRVVVWWWTHKIKGLTDIDYRFAEQTNQLFGG